MTNKGYTLSEVLITLGIIGIVAAMTIPALVSSWKKKDASAKIKRFYSMIQQAVKLSELDNGPASTWTKAAAVRDENGILIGSNEDAVEFFSAYIKPYIKVQSIKDNQVTFLDGSIVYLSSGNCLDMTYDFNGTKEPNKIGYDKFDFLLCTSAYNESYIGRNRYFGAYVQEKTMSEGREYALSLCKKNPLYCSTLLLIDVFEFKDDYPYNY